MSRKLRVAMYRYYNWEVSKHGEPFILCELCASKQPTVPKCILQKMADVTDRNCQWDEHDETRQS